jgi:hypothetical protein
MKFIFFLILFYFGFKLISRLVYIFLLRNITKNEANYTKQSSKKEGDVSIEKMPKKNKSKSDKLGDYVDYEEID